MKTKIEEACNKANKLQKELAEHLRLNKSQMSYLSNGLFVMTKEQIKKSCKFLNCKITDLYYLSDLSYIKKKRKKTTQEEKKTQLEQVIGKKTLRLIKGGYNLLELGQKYKQLTQQIKKDKKGAKNG